VRTAAKTGVILANWTPRTCHHGAARAAGTADSGLRRRRVTATFAWNNGLLPNPDLARENLSKDALKILDAPIAYFTGDEANGAYANAAEDFKRIDQVPVLSAYRIGMPHIGTYREPNGGEFGKIAVLISNGS